LLPDCDRMAGAATTRDAMAGDVQAGAAAAPDGTACEVPASAAAARDMMSRGVQASAAAAPDGTTCGVPANAAAARGPRRTEGSVQPGIMTPQR